MTNVEARLRSKGKEFEILVDVDKAIQLKKGMNVNIDNVLAVSGIFYDLKKGTKVSGEDLEEAFGTDDVREIAKKIILHGEVVLPTEYRKKEVDAKKKQVVDFLTRNSVDPTTGNPHTETRIRDALDRAGVKIDNKPIDAQISKILEELKKIIPIKIETKKLRIIVPAIYTGQAYGLFKENKEKEEWLNSGDLVCIINLPAGLQMEFYDKLNGITHGSAVVEEIKE